MAVRVVLCSSCHMWEAREQSGVLDNYFRKCDQLQLLTDCTVWLEKQLDTSLCIQETERVIDASFREVATTQVQTHTSVTARRGRQVKEEDSKGKSRTSQGQRREVIRGATESGEILNEYFALVFTKEKDMTDVE
eukprot:g47299.t1